MTPTIAGALQSAVVAATVRELLPPAVGEQLARLSEAGLLVPLAVGGGAVAVVGGAYVARTLVGGRSRARPVADADDSCDEERAEWEHLRDACEEADCSDEKRAVEDAEAKADRDERAAAVAAAHDDVRGASAGHGAAVDDYEAAEEAAERARDRLAEAKRALLDVLQAHYDERAAEMDTEAADLELVPVGDDHGAAVTFDAGGGVRAGFDVGSGFSESDLRRFARLMEADVREEVADSEAYREAFDAVRAAREAVAEADRDVDEARAALAASADDIETEDDDYRDAIEARDAADRRIEEAREHLAAARDALEACREEKRRLCEAADEARERLAECAEAAEAVARAEEAVAEAEADVEEAAADVEGVRSDANDVEGVDGDEGVGDDGGVAEDPHVGPKLDEAEDGVDEAEARLREAREKLEAAREKLRDDDYDGATGASGAAGRAASDASDAADDASDAADDAGDAAAAADAAADEIRANDRERRQQERRLKNCLDNFAAWVRDNEPHVDSDDVDALAELLRAVDEDLYRQYEALRESGALAEDDEEAREALEDLFWVVVRGGGDFGSVTLGGMAGGTGGGTAVATGSVPGVIAVAAFLLYAEAREAGMVAAKRVADEGAIRTRLKAFRTSGNPCSCEPKELEGELQGIEVDSATSWFLLCVDGPDQVLLFRITASHGLELLGVGDLTEGGVTASPLE